jgi:hypothetical protein
MADKHFHARFRVSPGKSPRWLCTSQILKRALDATALKSEGPASAKEPLAPKVLRSVRQFNVKHVPGSPPLVVRTPVLGPRPFVRIDQIRVLADKSRKKHGLRYSLGAS